MGVVYRAEDPAIGRTVAIKTIRLVELIADSERDRLRERLFREARSAGILSHPGIVTIYDIADEGETAYVFMEFVEGRTLEYLMNGDAPVPSDVIIETLRQTALALDYAHSKGIIHRDIKPANIMVSVDGHAKITDFGVARILSQQLTQAGTILGTPNYMSPEQVQGSAVDGRADQFSLAVIAFELLTGEKPYAADTLPTLLYKIAREQPAPPRRLNPTLGIQVDKVLEKAFSKQPSGRYSTCTEFVSALASAVNASPGWKPLKRGSVQALETVVTAHPATIVEAPRAEPREPEPPPKRQAAREAALPRRVAPRRLDDEPRRSRAGLIAMALLPFVLIAAGLFAYRRYYRSEPVAANTPSGASAKQTQEIPPAAPATPPRAEEPKIEAKLTPKPLSVAVADTSKPLADVVVASEHLVSVRTNPPGATVVADRDSSLSCTTPCELPLKQGRHVLASTLAGYRLSPRIIEVPEIVDLTIDMVEMSGTLAVTSKPPGATITLNGEMRAEKTPSMIKLPVGTYKIVLTLDDHSFEDQVVVQDQVITNFGVNW
jgi:serine/threonine-protein kinase